MRGKHKFIELAKGLGTGIPGLHVCSWPKAADSGRTFRWFNPDFGPDDGRAQSKYCLHFEILEGDDCCKEIKDFESGEQLYSAGVAYVELHFENLVAEHRRMIELCESKIKECVKDERFKNCLYIPDWQAVGFSVRYLCGKDNWGGIPFASAEDLDKVRDELGKRMAEFVILMKPWIEECKKIFEQEEKAMEKVKELKNLLEASKQIVLTGAPGTGKTYLARQIARSMVLNDEEKMLPEADIEKLVEKRTKFVQFHPSYDYTDFVEGLRPVQGADGQVGFKRQDGIFKELCKDAVAAGKRDGVDNFDEAWNEFIADLKEEHRKANPLLLTTPSCNFKVYVNHNNNLSFITSGAETTQGSLTKANVRYFYIDRDKKDPWRCYYVGVILYLKKEYKLKDYVEGKTVDKTSLQKFVMIIDEINRGDISKIFGELFYAIDDGYRGPTGKVETQYQKLVEDGDVFRSGFYVPDNVYIIGTMNDVDRNVESMDFAIRRRFTWEEITPEEWFDAMMGGLADKNGKPVDRGIVAEAERRMNNLNAAIRDKKNGLGDAYQIGPAYFRKIKDFDGDAANRFKILWEKHLNPLLREYLRGMPKADDTVTELQKAYDLTAEKKEDPAEDKLAE